MITSYEVGAVYRLVDEVTPTLRRMAEQFEAFERIVGRVRTNLLEISEIRFTGAARSAASFERSLTGIGRAADLAATALGGAARTMSTSLSAATAQAAALTAELRQAAAASRMIGTGGRGGGGGGGGGGGRGGGGGGGRHGPGGFRGGVGLAAHTPLGRGHIGFHGGGAGTAAAVGGGLAAYGVIDAMKDSMELGHQQALYRNMGGSEDENSSAFRTAWDVTQQVPGSHVADNLKIIGELRSIVGPEEALKMAPRLAQTQRVLGSLGKGEGEGAVMNIARSGELLGQFTDPKTHQLNVTQFDKFIDVIGKSAIGSHGTVTTQQWLALAQQGGPALGSLSEEGMLTEGVIMQAMKGNRAGTAAAALQRQFAGGIMSQRTAEALQAVGIAKAGDFEVRKGGHVVAKPGAMAELVKQLSENPLGAFRDTIIPALESHGVTTKEQFQGMTYKLFGTGPAQREAFELYRGREQIRAETERWGGASSISAAGKVLQEHDPTIAVSNFTGAFSNLMTALGGPLMDSAIPKINALASAMNSLGGWFADHKKTALTAASTIGGAGIGAALGGVGGFFTMGPAGVLPGAMLGARIGGGAGFAYGAAESAAIGISELKTAWPGDPTRRGTNPGRIAAQAAAGGGTTKVADSMTIVIQTPSADPQQHAEAFTEHVSRLLSQASIHNLDEGQGSLQSPWTAGK